MTTAGAWVHATIEWHGQLGESPGGLPSKPAGVTPLVTWPATEFDTTDTDCFTTGADYWVWQPEVGAVRFRLDNAHLDAFSWPGADESWFRQIVTRSWLPAIYPLWGRQVVHASAVQCLDTHECAAFIGPTHAGKSTTAYGLHRRSGWRLLSDDTIAYSIADGTCRLHPLPNGTSLRTASASYFGVEGQGTPITWPEGTPVLRAVYVLDGDPDRATVASFTRLRASEALPRLLQQAFTLSFELPKYNQQLMKDYVALAAAVPVFELRYRRSFDVADELFGSIHEHLAQEVGLSCPAGAAPDTDA